MNYQTACCNLGLSINEDWQESDLKRQYRRLALLNHPDKNKSADATHQFQQIQESYEYLMKYQGFIDTNDYHLDEEEDQYPDQNNKTQYSHILFSYLNPILESELFQIIKTRLLYKAIYYILNQCESKAIDFLTKIDKRVFHKIRELLRIYRDIFHLSDEFLDKLDLAYSNKVQCDECIVLNPFLNDLFDNNLYRLTENGNTYLIPLWHHELVYDNSGSELYVQCIPILPEGIEIDENNNIHVELEYTLDNLWKMNTIQFRLGNKSFTIPRDQLKMISNQTFILYNCGISRININEIYDVSKRADIIVSIKVLS